MKRTVITSVLLLTLTCVCCNRPSPEPTVVLVVRHAEKATDTDDTPLSEAGVKRAQALVRMAETSNLKAIYTTQYKRSHETAQPLADHLGIATNEVPVNLETPGNYGVELGKRIMDEHSGETVLIVGHRNTIPSIVEALSGRHIENLEDEYSTVFVIVKSAGGARLIRARYGDAR